jgi:curved DNA-binding protein
MADDYYSVLGVTREADAEALKRAYRKLAKDLHPDKNPGNAKVEARFKAVNRAYGILSDADKRALYNEFGDAGLRANFDAQRARAAQRKGPAAAKGPQEATPHAAPHATPGRPAPQVHTVTVRSVEGDPSPAEAGARSGFDVLGGIFGGRRKTAVRGADYEGEITLAFMDALQGTTVDLRGLPDAFPLLVRVEPGTEDGARIYIPSRGAPSMGGGEPGDLVVRVRVAPHGYFRRDREGLHLDLPLTLAEAYFGAKLKVPTGDGPVQLKVPPFTQTGTVLRLKGKGVKTRAGVGDLFVHFRVQVPTGDAPGLAQWVDASKRFQTKDPRPGMDA